MAKLAEISLNWRQFIHCSFTDSIHSLQFHGFMLLPLSQIQTEIATTNERTGLGTRYLVLMSFSVDELSAVTLPSRFVTKKASKMIQ